MTYGLRILVSVLKPMIQHQRQAWSLSTLRSRSLSKRSLSLAEIKKLKFLSSTHWILIGWTWPQQLWQAHQLIQSTTMVAKWILMGKAGFKTFFHSNKSTMSVAQMLIATTGLLKECLSWMNQARTFSCAAFQWWEASRARQQQTSANTQN
jgi:hypothetical protein